MYIDKNVLECRWLESHLSPHPHSHVLTYQNYESFLNLISCSSTSSILSLTFVCTKFFNSVLQSTKLSFPIHVLSLLVTPTESIAFILKVEGRKLSKFPIFFFLPIKHHQSFTFHVFLLTFLSIYPFWYMFFNVNFQKVSHFFLYVIERFKGVYCWHFSQVYFHFLCLVLSRAFVNGSCFMIFQTLSTFLSINLLKFSFVFLCFMLPVSLTFEKDPFFLGISIIIFTLESFNSMSYDFTSNVN